MHLGGRLPWVLLTSGGGGDVLLTKGGYSPSLAIFPYFSMKIIIVCTGLGFKGT